MLTPQILSASFDIVEQRQQRRALRQAEDALQEVEMALQCADTPSPSRSKTQEEDLRLFYSVPVYPDIPDDLQDSWKKEK